MSDPVDRNNKAGRGRPKGLFGSSFLRRHLRLEREAQIAEIAAEPKRSGRPVGRNAGSSSASDSGILPHTSLPSSLSYLQQLVLMQAIEQSRICPSSQPKQAQFDGIHSGKSSESLGPSGSVSDLESLELLGNMNNPAEKILFQGRRNILSARAAKDDFYSFGCAAGRINSDRGSWWFVDRIACLCQRPS